jgi:hypothetical protein
MLNKWGGKWETDYLLDLALTFSFHEEIGGRGCCRKN